MRRTGRLPIPTVIVSRWVSRWVSRVLLLSLAATSAAACRVPGGVDGGPGPTSCPAGGDGLPDGAPPATPTTLTLVIGTDDPSGKHVATPWHDGDHVPLVAGGQGGFMIRPAFDVTAPAPLDEDSSQATCLGVTMLAGTPATAGPLELGARAPRIAGTTATYHVPALFGLLTYNSQIDGVSLSVVFYVHTSDPVNDGYASMTVVPDAALEP